MPLSRVRGSKGTTIEDVARAAGVSVSTVSRVLNDKDDVSPDTYRKVRDVIAELGYTSSLAAKSLRSRQTRVIGLIMPELGDSFCIELMKGIHQALVATGYDLIAYTSGSITKRSKAEREQHYVSLLNGSLTDGMIVVTPAAVAFPTEAPVVAIDPNDHMTGCPAVTATNHAGAADATGYLLGLGHRRIGFIGGRPDLQCARERLEGYEDALRRAGIAPDPDLVATGDFSRATARACAARLLALPERPTAIFAANDQSAIGAIETAREAGLRVPDDLSVVGFDNIPESAYLKPALTTVDQFIVRMGYAAAEMLIRLIQGERLGDERLGDERLGGEPGESRPCEIPTQLVVRDSCRAVPAA